MSEINYFSSFYIVDGMNCILTRKGSSKAVLINIARTAKKEICKVWVKIKKLEKRA